MEVTSASAQARSCLRPCFRCSPGRCTTASASTPGALARGGNAIVPFYRAFITDNIVSPENGEQSRRLAAAMQQHLLTREPYRSYGVTLDELFEEGSFRVHEDLYLLSDQVFGWDSDYRVLRDAGIEGVRAHPGTYARASHAPSGTNLPRPSSALVASDGKLSRPSEPRQSSSVASASPRRPRESRSRRVRSSGSRGPISESVRSGRRRRSGTSSSTDPDRPRTLRRDPTRSRRPLRRAPDRTGTPSSHFGSTSSRAGTPGPGCGSCSACSQSRSVERAAPTLIALDSCCDRRRDPERARPLRRPPLRAARRTRVRALRAGGLLGTDVTGCRDDRPESRRRRAQRPARRPRPQLHARLAAARP